jgi:hypothetical protein
MVEKTTFYLGLWTHSPRYTTHSSRRRQASRWRRPPMAIPLSGRVPGRASGPSQSRVNDGGRSQCVSRKLIRYLGFSRRGVFIGKGAASEVDQVGLTIGRRDQALGRTPWWWDHHLAQLCLLFGVLEALLNIWMFGFCFVQFRKYFLCNFSETQKQQKIGNWHYGISLIG